jgi:hypothetical protein
MPLKLTFWRRKKSPWTIMMSSNLFFALPCNSLVVFSSWCNYHVVFPLNMYNANITLPYAFPTQFIINQYLDFGVMLYIYWDPCLVNTLVPFYPLAWNLVSSKGECMVKWLIFCVTMVIFAWCIVFKCL